MVTVKTKEYAASDWLGPVERIEALTEAEAAAKYKNRLYKSLVPAYSNSDSRVYACEVSGELENTVFSIENQVARSEALAQFEGTQHFDEGGT